MYNGPTVTQGRGRGQSPSLTQGGGGGHGVCAGTPPQMRQSAQGPALGMRARWAKTPNQKSVHAQASIKGTQTERVAHPLARPGNGGRYATHRAPAPTSPSPLPASAIRCAVGLGPPGASAAALPPSTLPARAYTPPPLAAARPKLQLDSVRAWRRPAALLLPRSHGGGDAALSA
jgi:hypothetical protein